MARSSGTPKLTNCDPMQQVWATIDKSLDSIQCARFNRYKTRLLELALIAQEDINKSSRSDYISRTHVKTLVELLERIPDMTGNDD